MKVVNGHIELTEEERAHIEMTMGAKIPSTEINAFNAWLKPGVKNIIAGKNPRDGFVDSGARH